MGVGIGGVRLDISEFLQVMYTKPLDICLLPLFSSCDCE